MYDTIIVGGGPAGLTAAIYVGRKKLKHIIISGDIGGQVNLTSHIENYPGVMKTSGLELVDIFHKQAKEFGSEFVFGKVTEIKKTEDGFELTADNGNNYQTKSVILAFGKVPRRLGVPGEDKFMGRGVSTCATCDGPLYKNKTVIIVGGGNSAMEGALDLANHASKVYLIHRRDGFRADEVTVEEVKKHPKIEMILESVVTEVIGDKFVTGANIKNVKTEEVKKIDIDGLFLEIGYVVDTSLVKDLLDINEKNEIVVDSLCKTSQKGIFAAGDMTNTPYKQVIIAAGEGAKAALQVYSYVTGKAPVQDKW